MYLPRRWLYQHFKWCKKNVQSCSLWNKKKMLDCVSGDECLFFGNPIVISKICEVSTWLSQQ